MPVKGRHDADGLVEYVLKLAREWRVTAESKLACWLTADRGSNIKKAILNSCQFIYVPCLQHVLHRVVVSGITNVGMNVAWKQLTRLAGHFNRSAITNSMYDTWCRENNCKV